MHTEKHVSVCTQDPRINRLETSMAVLAEAVVDVKDILKTSIRNEERIRTMEHSIADIKKHQRRTEATQAGMKWMEKVVYAMVLAGLGLLWKAKEYLWLTTKD